MDFSVLGPLHSVKGCDSRDRERAETVAAIRQGIEQFDRGEGIPLKQASGGYGEDMAFGVEISARACQVVDNTIFLCKKPGRLNLTRWKGRCRESFKDLGYTRVDEFIEEVRGGLKGKVLRVKDKL